MSSDASGSTTPAAVWISTFRSLFAGFATKADALWVGAASELVDGAAGRLNASAAGVTRVRTGLDGSRGFTLGGGRLSLNAERRGGVAA